MLFNSYQFLIFFPLVTVLYFLLPHKFRWLHLLVASCVFYMAFVPVYILILFLTIVIDYIAGILIDKEQGPRRKLFLSMSIVANVGVLAFFKYYNFFAENVNHLFSITATHANVPLLNIILPIGLSFHTFQAMSYTIEVYRGNQKPERHFGIYALYVMFYPQLVAGPIERPQNMIHQFHEKHEFKYDDVVAGLRMMVWGFFKKCVIADRLALFTDPVFANPKQYPPLILMLGAVFFAFQIFCDFSGYSNIALGAARVMGFKLMVNFNTPYNSKSISEYWRRWHISLSTWFNDYLFTPLAVGLRNRGILAVIIASMTTFLLSGLWHGARWTFIVWGGLHGLAITYEVLTKKLRKKFFKKLPKKLGDFIGQVCTFTYVCFTYIFFASHSLHNALYITGRIPAAIRDLLSLLRAKMPPFILPISSAKFALCVVVIMFMEWIHTIQKKKSLNNMLQHQPRYLRWGVYYFFIFITIYMGVFQNRQFIYFQF
jgi:alginate O-acetyltransferase complex protein AlgI